MPAIIPAFSYFSAVSQADANAKAIAMGCTSLTCASGALVQVDGYSDAMFDNPGQSGSVVGTFEFLNVQSPFLGSTWYTGNVSPSDFPAWVAMQNTRAITGGGNITRLGVLQGGGPEQYSNCGFTGCNPGESIFDQIGQTLTFYSGGTTWASQSTNPWDGVFALNAGNPGECARYDTETCVGIGGQLNNTIVIEEGPPFVVTFYVGGLTPGTAGHVLWTGESALLAGEYVRTGGLSANPASLVISGV